MEIANWNIEEMTGYKPKTTFYTDFSIAEAFGTDAIRDTYERAFNEWKTDTEYVTELVMALNWKSLEHHDRALYAEECNDQLASDTHTDLCELYCSLYEEADAWCMDNLKDDDLAYFIRTTD